MDAPLSATGPEAKTAATDVLSATRKSNGFRDTIAFTGGLRNLFRIPKVVRSAVAYARNWRRVRLTLKEE